MTPIRTSAEDSYPHDPAEAIASDLEAGSESRLTRYIGHANSALRAFEIVVLLFGLGALGLAIAAWRAPSIGFAVIVIICMPAVLLPAYVIWRTGALAKAVSNPRELADQAKGLISRVRHSDDLAKIGALLDREDNKGKSATKKSKLGMRKGYGLAKSAVSLIGEAQPDPENEPLLVPLSPERLGRTWLAVVWSFWGLLLAIFVAAISIVALIAGLF